MCSSFAIRVAAIGDVPQVRDMLIDTWHNAYDGMLGNAEVSQHCSRLFSPESVAWHIRDDRLNRFYVAEAENRIAGVAQCGIGPYGTLTVYMLYVHPDFQRRGLGRKLMTVCAGTFTWANALAVEVLEPNTSAIAFYEKFGFDLHEAISIPARSSVPIAYMTCSLRTEVSRWIAFRQYLRLMTGLPPLPMPRLRT